MRFTPTARRQFLGAIRTTARDNLAAALRFREKAEAGLKRLEDLPQSGRRIPEFPDLPHREVILKPYRLFYRLKGKTLWVVAVWHGAQIPDDPDAP